MIDEDDEDGWDHITSTPSDWEFWVNDYDGVVVVFTGFIKDPDYSDHTEEFIGEYLSPLSLYEESECEWGYGGEIEDTEEAKKFLTARLIEKGFVYRATGSPSDRFDR